MAWEGCPRASGSVHPSWTHWTHSPVPHQGGLGMLCEAASGPWIERNFIAISILTSWHFLYLQPESYFYLIGISVVSPPAVGLGGGKEISFFSRNKHEAHVLCFPSDTQGNLSLLTHQTTLWGRKSCSSVIVYSLKSVNFTWEHVPCRLYICTQISKILFFLWASAWPMFWLQNGRTAGLQENTWTKSSDNRFKYLAANCLSESSR